MAGGAVTVLDAEVDVRRGGFHLVASLHAGAGEVVALVGPNGAGKSTLVRAIAGLERPAGRMRIDADDVSSQPPEQRRVAWVPQAVALFPHLNVLDNIAFGAGRRHGRDVAAQWLERLELTSLASRRPAQLSGGQAQKVALARALARRPRVLLLDEPLAALDVATRTDVRATLRTHLSSFDGVAIVVTHDPVDVAMLAQRLVAVEGGRVVQDASLHEVVRAPRSTWLATMLGTNAVTGRVEGDTIAVTDGGRLVGADQPPDGAGVVAVFAPHSVALHRDRPAGSARNTWPVVIEHLTDIGGRVRVDAAGAPRVVAEVTAAAVADLSLRPGDQVWASVKATEVTIVVL